MIYYRREAIVHMEKEIQIENIMQEIRSKIASEDRPVAEKYLASPYYEKRMETLRQCPEIIIVGAGVYGRRLYEMMEAEGMAGRVCGICDNSRERRMFHSFPAEVLSVEEAVLRFPNADYVITPQMYENELLQQLSKLGLPVEHIMIFTFAYTGLVD